MNVLKMVALDCWTGHGQWNRTMLSYAEAVLERAHFEIVKIVRTHQLLVARS